MTKRVVSLLALSALVSTAFAQDGSRYIGPSAGVFFPSTGLLKEFVGDQWYSFGLALTSGDRVPDRQRFGSDLNFINGERGTSKVFVGSFTYGLTIPLGAPAPAGTKRQFNPYVAVRAGVSYYDYAVQVTVTDRRSNKAFGPSGNVEIGAMVGDRVSLSARYDFLGSRDGLDFSGFSLQLTYGIVRF